MVTGYAAKASVKLHVWSVRSRQKLVQVKDLKREFESVEIQMFSLFSYTQNCARL